VCIVELWNKLKQHEFYRSRRPLLFILFYFFVIFLAVVFLVLLHLRLLSGLLLPNIHADLLQ